MAKNSCTLHCKSVSFFFNYFHSADAVDRIDLIVNDSTNRQIQKRFSVLPFAPPLVFVLPRCIMIQKVIVTF